MNLSYTQQYYLCAINDKGRMPAFRKNEVVTCFVTGGTIELIEKGYIIVDEKSKFEIIKPWDNKLPHLEPLYKLLRMKPMKVEKVMNQYLASLSEKNTNDLVRAIGESLEKIGYADKKLGQGLFNNLVTYAPKQVCATEIIEKLRTDFLSEGETSEDKIILGSLLLNSKIIGNYFSKVESDKLKERIKEIKANDSYKIVKKMLSYIDSSFVVIASVVNS